MWLKATASWPISSVGRGLDPLVELAARDGRGALGELLDGPGDPPGDQRRRQPAEQQRHHGQGAQLAAGSAGSPPPCAAWRGRRRTVPHFWPSTRTGTAKS